MISLALLVSAIPSTGDNQTYFFSLYLAPGGLVRLPECPAAISHSAQLNLNSPSTNYSFLSCLPTSVSGMAVYTAI